jgi:hypothetical protein
MTDANCETHGCALPAAYYLKRLNQRRFSVEKKACIAHAEQFFVPNSFPDVVGDQVDISVPGTIGFDLEYMLFDLRQQAAIAPCDVGLREIGGTRRFSIKIGYCESWAMDTAFRPNPTPRPLTYPLLATVIRGLNATLRYVLIDDFSKPDKVFRAKLSISRDGDMVTFDARPSDAMILAVVCAVSILVSKQVLASLT